VVTSSCCRFHLYRESHWINGTLFARSDIFPHRFLRSWNNASRRLCGCRRHEFARWSDNYRTEAVAAIQNKFRPFVVNGTIRTLTAHKRKCLTNLAANCQDD